MGLRRAGQLCDDVVHLTVVECIPGAGCGVTRHGGREGLFRVAYCLRQLIVVRLAWVIVNPGSLLNPSPVPRYGPALTPGNQGGQVCFRGNGCAIGIAALDLDPSCAEIYGGAAGIYVSGVVLNAYQVAGGNTV